MKLKQLCLCLSVLLCPSLIIAQDLVPIPKAQSLVTDLTATLAPTQKRELENLLATFQRSKGSQVALVMLPTTRPETIEQYSIRLAEAWQVGRKKVDDGVILLVALKDRRLRIEVGYGLEGALTDVLSHRIIEDIITPNFKQGQIYSGVQAGLIAIMQVIQGEELPVAKVQNRSGLHSSLGRRASFLLLFVLVILAFIMRSIFGSGIAFLLSLGFGVLLGYFLLSWLNGLFLGLFAALFSLSRGGAMMGAMGMGMGYRSYGSGYSGGGGLGGGGFGGFGGGGFGGGGASGGW